MIAALALALPLARATPAFQHESFHLRLARGTPLSVRVKKSPGAPGRLPAVLVFGGFQNAAEVLDLLEPTDPVMLASFDYPFSPERRWSFPGSLRFAPDAKRAMRDTIEGIGALAERLAERADVDPRRIVLIGASLGAPLALAAAARPTASATEEKALPTGARFRALVLVQPLGDIPLVAATELYPRWRERVGTIAWPLARAFGWLAWRYLDLPSPEESAMRLPPGLPVLVLEARDDDRVPASARASIRDALVRSEARVDFIALPGRHLAPGADRQIAEILRETSAWLARRGF